jgi:O-succinylbenzoate synthase
VKALSPHSQIRVDVNGSWSAEHALMAINSIYEIIGDAFQYIEQPCETIEELRRVKGELKVPVKIAGDEVFRKAQDPFAVKVTDALDIMILKVAPLGGIRRSLELAAHHKLPTVVSSALESAIGLSYELKLAATLPELNYACGLGTGSLLQFDVADVTIVNGHITVQSLIPDQNALDTLRASDERFAWWQDRIRKTWSAGAAQWLERESEEWK